VETALAEYEQAMFDRAAAEAADDLYEVMFGDDAPHGLVALLAGAEDAAE
jgi:hypothetical protein